MELCLNSNLETSGFHTQSLRKAEIYTFIWNCEQRTAVLDEETLLEDVH